MPKGSVPRKTHIAPTTPLQKKQVTMVDGFFGCFAQDLATRDEEEKSHLKMSLTDSLIRYNFKFLYVEMIAVILRAFTDLSTT